MNDAFVPQDQEARHRIHEALGENLFVEAGAGTGKTSSLVDRMVGLVASGRATLDRVAAITFTEAAAAELRDHVREALERATADVKRSDKERTYCAEGVVDLDRSAIQTLHSFAGSLLRERPLEAGLPPAFENLDQIAAKLAFEEAWEMWLDSTLDDSGLQPALRLALSLGLTLDHLHQVAQAFHASYDLLEAASFPDTLLPQPETVAALATEVPEMERLCAFSRNGDNDPLAAHVRAVVGVGRRLQEMDQASVAAWRVLAQSLPIRAPKRGRVDDWDIDPETKQNSCTRLKALLKKLDAKAREDLAEAQMACLMPLLRAVKEFVLGYAAERKRQGHAEFHDLLVWARNLLRDNLEVRDHFRERYAHLLLDEAQDTDPIQAEIATFLVEEVSPGTPPEARPRRWTEVCLAQGKLFVVGDPKQSIYRFRRADVAVMARFQASIAEQPVNLVQNFRSQRPVVAWVNHLFQVWMQGDGQAAYVPIVHRWEPNTDHPQRPAVWALGGPLDEKSVAQVRRQEAGAIASLVRRIKAEEWPVLDREATERDGTERFKPAQFKDVCIIMPQRTALRPLELALADRDVPYRLEGVSLVFATQEVRDLLNCLRAVDDPSDQVALVAALRSPAFACADADLLAFVEAGGRLDFLSEGNPADGTVAAALRVLRRYHEQHLWVSPAALIEKVVRDRQLLEAALGAPRPREQWRRYAFLVGQARAFAEAGGRTLRAFLKWVAGQAEEGARVTEVPVPEADEDAVRVMTVHGAKGLEFPIVVLTGLNFEPSSRVDSVVFDREEGGAEVRLGAQPAPFQTPRYEVLAQREEEFELAEDVRLMYVAATRARDHLVVSLYRMAKDQKSRATLIAHHLEGAEDLWQPAVADEVSLPIASYATEEPVEDSPEERQRWLDERAQLLLKRAQPSAVAATALAKIVKEEASVPEEPWRRGRAGTTLGRAVHAVLQTIDLATGQGLEDTARAQAAAEGIPHREAEVVKLARVALGSETVQRAVASGRWWREVPVAAPVGETVLEGFIDLLFEEDGGLVVVDYKTDVLETKEEAGERTRHYRLQGGAYALAVQAATGSPVKEVIFLFLQPEGERLVQDLSAAMAEAKEAALSQGKSEDPE